jgi:hypothetical protein
MLPVGFEPTIPGNERPQTHVLDRTATGTGDLRSTQFISMLRSLSPLFDRHFVNRALAVCFFIRLRVRLSGVTLPTEAFDFSLLQIFRDRLRGLSTKTTTHLHLVPKLRMSGTIPTQPHTHRDTLPFTS